MAVTIKLMGDLCRFADSETIEIAEAGCTLGAALDELIRRHSRLGGELFDDQNRLRYTTLLVLNGRSLTWPQDRDVLMEDDAELLIMRFVAGG